MSLGHAPMSRPLIVGISEGAAGWGGRSTGPEIAELVRRTGSHWYRDQFFWNQIEPRPGVFHFGYYDHYMLLAARRGLHIVAQLAGSPRWAAPNSTAVPANPRPFARFVAAFVHRYGPGGTFWHLHPQLSDSAITTYELWNEPYFSSGNGGHYDPKRYARLVEAAATAGHKVAPSTTFLLEADMESHWNKVWTWWVDALYKAAPHLNRYFDGVAVHDFGSRANMTRLSPMVYGKPYPNFGRIRRIEDLRRQFVSHGAGDKPFWILESGWPTCTTPHNPNCVSAARQASDLSLLFRYVTTRWRAWVQAEFVYRYQDGIPANSPQGGFGLVHVNGSPKPALKVFRHFLATTG